MVDRGEEQALMECLPCARYCSNHQPTSILNATLSSRYIIITEKPRHRVTQLIMGGSGLKPGNPPSESMLLERCGPT
jgi:hypothetical protein